MYSLMQISVENSRTMILTRNIIFLLFICVTNIRAHSLPELESKDLNINRRDVNKVDVKLYYNSLGYDSRHFYFFIFFRVIKMLEPYLNIHTYPFGNTKIIEDNGNVSFVCPHGPDECYGNKLHACALDCVRGFESVVFNRCLMTFSGNSDGSDDEAADMCGQALNMDVSNIKDCAKSTRGSELLLFYGERSKKANFTYVPHLLINGQMYYPDNHFFKDLCDAFDVKPHHCENID